MDLTRLFTMFAGISAAIYGVLLTIGFGNLIFTPRESEVADPLYMALVGPKHPRIFRLLGILMFLQNIGVVALSVYVIFNDAVYIPDFIWAVTAIFALYMAIEAAKYAFSHVSPEDWEVPRIHRRMVSLLQFLIGWNALNMVAAFLLLSNFGRV